MVTKLGRKWLEELWHGEAAITFEECIERLHPPLPVD
jgi:hypothetical protein